MFYKFCVSVMKYNNESKDNLLAPSCLKVNVFHWINRYSLENAIISFPNTAV